MDMAKVKLHIARFFAFVVALQILNMSIYTQDFQPLVQHSHTIGDINEINSFVEYVAEVVLDYKDALPEYQHYYNNHKELQLHKHISVKLISLEQESTEKLVLDNTRRYRPSLKESYDYLYYKEINPPPPKA
jgi:hypothetical protein